MNFKEAYAVKPQDLGKPVLDEHGRVVDVRPMEPAQVIYDL